MHAHTSSTEERQSLPDTVLHAPTPCAVQTEMPIRIVVADEQVLVRVGLAAWFAAEGGFDLAGEARTVAELESVVVAKQPDVLISEYRLAGIDALPAIVDLQRRFPRMQSVVYSDLDNPTNVAQCRKADLRAYVLKSQSRDALLLAVQNAAAGRDSWSSRRVRRRRGTVATSPMPERLDHPLTQREGEVLSQVVKGLTNKQVAKALAISPDTVKEHVQRILGKIGVRDRTQAALWVVRQTTS